MKICNICNKEKPIDEFYVRSNGKRRKDCRDCKNKMVRKYQLENPEKTRRSKMKSKYRLSDAEYDEAESKTHCEICLVSFKDYNKVYDHCHLTGKFRGVLCCSCNKALGFFKDNKIALQQALKYLEDKNGG